ncbi:SIS domain-containing protein [Jeotgalibacillus marinus]|uniref:UPF0309 protein AB1471_11405 n=1 Tax=Jeotgalibacillus marinus TaxID=86667 RepID=A0ABV3Q5I7_9BACL
MIDEYFRKIMDLLEFVKIEERESILKAAAKVSTSIRQDGIIHIFGVGHSHILGEEVFYRAGGLAPINPIFVEELMLHKGASRSSRLEKENNFARSFMSNEDIRSNDLVIVISTSGRNPVPVDVARWSQKKGAFVIGITSLAYAISQPSRHKEQYYLYQSADLVIDNHIGIGDTLMNHPDFDESFGSGSTVVGTVIMNAIMIEAINIMLKNGYHPPIFKSGNVDGSEEHNRALVEKYKGRIKRLI